MTIYVWRLFDRAFGFTSDKEDTQDFVSYVEAASRRKQAAAIHRDHRWEVWTIIGQTGGVVYIVAGIPPQKSPCRFRTVNTELRVITRVRCHLPPSNPSNLTR